MYTYMHIYIYAYDLCSENGHVRRSRRRCAWPASRAQPVQEGGYKATWKRKLKFPWREAGPPNHLDDAVLGPLRQPNLCAFSYK